MGVFSDYFSDARFIFYELLKFSKVLKCFSDFKKFFSEITFYDLSEPLDRESF